MDSNHRMPVTCSVRPPARRRVRRVASAALAVTLLAGGAAACGDDDTAAGDTTTTTTTTTEAAGAEPASLDHEGFVEEVTGLCMKANEEMEEADEAEESDDPAVMAAGMRIYADSLNGFVTDTRALDVPAEDAETTDAMLSPLAEMAAAFEDGASRIEGGEAPEAVEADMPFHLFGEAEQAAMELGLENGLGACGEEPEEVADGANVVEVAATDFAFELPAEVPAGPTAFVMANEGEEPHFMLVVKMKEGATIDEALAAEEAGEDPEAFLEEEVGDSTTVGPGGESVLNADLTPGNYAMLCFVHSEDGAPHAAKGMVSTFTVR